MLTEAKKLRDAERKKVRHAASVLVMILLDSDHVSVLVDPRHKLRTS